MLIIKHNTGINNTVFSFFPLSLSALFAEKHTWNMKSEQMRQNLKMIWFVTVSIFHHSEQWAYCNISGCYFWSQTIWNAPATQLPSSKKPKSWSKERSETSSTARVGLGWITYSVPVYMFKYVYIYIYITFIHVYCIYLHPRMDANFLPFRRFPSIGRLFPDVLEMGIFGHTWPFQIPCGSFLLWAPLKPFWLWLGFGEPTLLGMVRPPPCFAVHVVLSVLVHAKFHFSFSKAFLLLNSWMQKKHEAGKSVSRM